MRTPVQNNSDKRRNTFIYENREVQNKLEEEDVLNLSGSKLKIVWFSLYIVELSEDQCYFR